LKGAIFAQTSGYQFFELERDSHSGLKNGHFVELIFEVPGNYKTTISSRYEQRKDWIGKLAESKLGLLTATEADYNLVLL